MKRSNLAFDDKIATNPSGSRNDRQNKVLKSLYRDLGLNPSEFFHLQFFSFYLSAYCFWKVINELYLSGILIRRRTPFNKFLKLFCQGIRRFIILCQDDKRLYNLAPNLIRTRNNCGFFYGRVFYKNALYLKGPDTVS